MADLFSRVFKNQPGFDMLTAEEMGTPPPPSPSKPKSEIHKKTANVSNASTSTTGTVERPKRLKPLECWSDARPTEKAKKGEDRHRAMVDYYKEASEDGGAEGVVVEYGALKRASLNYLQELKTAEEGTPMAAIAEYTNADGFREGFYEVVRAFFDAAVNEIVEVAAINANRERGSKSERAGGRKCTKEDIEVAISHIQACRNN